MTTFLIILATILATIALVAGTFLLYGLKLERDKRKLLEKTNNETKKYNDLTNNFNRKVDELSKEFRDLKITKEEYLQKASELLFDYECDLVELGVAMFETGKSLDN